MKDAQDAIGRLDLAIARTVDWFLSEQHADGYWCGELEGDSILESEYVLLLAWLGQARSAKARRVAADLLRQQLPDGGWGQYPGSRIDISASVKAYFALKLTGFDPQSEPLQRARRAIRDAGGAHAVNSFTRFYLALLGQIDFRHCPAVPPEMMLLATWFPINIYRISAWSRTIFVPLAIVWAYRPVQAVETGEGIDELFVRPRDAWPALRSPGDVGLSSRIWGGLFRGIDRAIKMLERFGCRPCRQSALQAAEDWVLARSEGSDGLGAIFPPIIWSAIALRCRGYDIDSPEVIECLSQLDRLMIHDDTTRIQPCQSPVWDTALAVRALAREPSAEAACCAATNWLVGKEVRRRGDWAAYVDAEPAGWFFEFNNVFYPDVDDTVMVMMALCEFRQSGSAMLAPLCDQIEAAGSRAYRWTLAMQNRDGGWGAFDRDNDREFLCYVPFADHNAMIDPSTPDITARVLEALAKHEFAIGDSAVDRAVAFLRQTQEPDGSWFGRWGVNYLYGTWQVLVGLTSVGVPTTDPAVRHAADWLARHQQSDGGWGESPDSYLCDGKRGAGPTTASQTAWAVLGLLAAGRQDSPEIARAVEYLLDTQCEDGRWQEYAFTGTGFPRVFYLRYDLYPIYFPLMALAEFRSLMGTAASRAESTAAVTSD
jgi:squalene-hopene/tetraprenyl-beta-curcumene cyclase